MNKKYRLSHSLFQISITLYFSFYAISFQLNVSSFFIFFVVFIFVLIRCCIVLCNCLFFFYVRLFLIFPMAFDWNRFKICSLPFILPMLLNWSPLLLFRTCFIFSCLFPSFQSVISLFSPDSLFEIYFFINTLFCRGKLVFIIGFSVTYSLPLSLLHNVWFWNKKEILLASNG